MGWTATFIAALRAPSQRWGAFLRWVGGGWGAAVGGPALFTSAAKLHPTAPAVITDPVTYQGQGITLGTWAPSYGTLSVGLAGVAALRLALTSIPKGSPVMLQLRPGGGFPTDVFLGQVQDITGRLPDSQVVIWDIIAAMRSRWDSDLSTDTSQAFKPGNSQPLAANYSPGDTTLTFGSSGALASFDRETGGTGLVLVTPSSGSPFYLTWTGKSGSTLTGVSTTGQRNTTAVGASIADQVQGQVYIVGHPMDIARKVMSSTGTGANGAWDVLPASWGFGISDAYIDHVDISTWRALLSPSAGSYELRMIIEGPADDGLTAIQSLLSLAGVWMCQRQGRITVRAVVDITTAGGGGAPVAMSIDRTNVLEWVEFYQYDSAIALEHYGVRVDYYQPSAFGGAADESSGAPATQPTGYRMTYDATALIGQNELNIANDIAERIRPWACRRPSVGTMICTLDAARLVPGDVVSVTSPAYMDRQTVADGRTSFVGRRGMVLTVNVNWTGGTVAVKVAFPMRAAVG